VFSTGKGFDLNIDMHRAGSHNNLYTNIDVGLGQRAFFSGGDVSRGMHAGEHGQGGEG